MRPMRLFCLPSLIGLALLFAPALATSAHARPCLTKAEALTTAKAEPVHYRQVHGTQCWYAGVGADKSEFEPPRPAKVYSPEERSFWLCGPFCNTMIKEQWPRR